MFGINKKIYFIISGVLLVFALVVVILGLLSMIDLNRLVILFCIAIFLLSVCVFIQPYNKQLKIVTKLLTKYRPLLYKEFENFDKGFDTVVVKENSEGKLYIDFKKRLLIDELNVAEAEYILLKLIKDYVIIMYSVYENNKLNLKKSTIEQFIVKFNLTSKESHEVKIVEEYKVL